MPRCTPVRSRMRAENRWKLRAARTSATSVRAIWLSKAWIARWVAHRSFRRRDTGCLRVDVTFFKRYANAWAARGDAGGFVTSWGPNHEMYVVTVWGKLASPARGPTSPGPGHDYFYIDQLTFQIDATTGQGLLSGGIPLPLNTPGLVSYRRAT